MANVSSKVGKVFEGDFYKSCPEDMLLIRLKDGKGYGRNPCDFILITRFRGYMLELKTTKEKRLARSNIRDHQLDILSTASSIGIPAYFIVNFREYNETYLLDALDARKYYDTGAKSIPISWFRENCKQITQNKIRTRWRYVYPFV